MSTSYIRYIIFINYPPLRGRGGHKMFNGKLLWLTKHIIDDGENFYA